MVQAIVADPSKPFVLQTDASEVGLGAVLGQKDDDGNEHQVAYASQKLLPREVNYDTIEKEYVRAWLLYGPSDSFILIITCMARI